LSLRRPQRAGDSPFEPLPSDDPFHYSRLDLPRGDLWVYTYGSLMWDPGFRFIDAAPALLRGYHRTFCIYSSRYRGTVAAPGLVLGLDRGGACKGTAYRVATADISAALDALWQREMRRRVYVPRLLPVGIGTRRRMALTFLANRRHDGYAGRLTLDDAANIIAACCGERGPNVDYLVNTLRHLDALGVHDHHLHRLLAAVRARQTRAALQVLPAPDRRDPHVKIRGEAG
jgi:glutathione-specific gamma-glutamylcyclotransferase